jgi:hypothetical protein
MVDKAWTDPWTSSWTDQWKCPKYVDFAHPPSSIHPPTFRWGLVDRCGLDLHVDRAVHQVSL